MMGKIKYLAILLCLVNFSVSLSYDDDELPTVTLPYGTIKGLVLQTANNNTYYSFKEIPYADHPKGELRFKEPVAPKNWTGIYDATKNKNICYQQSSMHRPSDLTQSEDCLYLNVYTPVEPGNSSETTLPVLVSIHGGAFVMGDGTSQSLGPEYFIDYNIIIVTINYRLGPLGFLTTEDGVIPGNLGIKDQHFALQWIKNNINLFGGNPEKITISGGSAGGASVGLHLVSKKAKGLFSSAILQSATGICPLSRQPFARYYAFELGRTLNPNISSDNSTELLNLLQTADASDIMNAKISIPSDKESGTGEPWGPIIESDDLEGAYVTGPTQEHIKNGNFNQVPILLGFNSEEAMLDVINDKGAGLKIIGTSIDKNLTKIFYNIFNMTDENKYIAGKKIREIYTDGQFQDDLSSIIRYTSDANFTTAVIRHAEIQSIYTDVYLYQFAYKGELGGASINIEGVDGGGVSHGEELSYMWSSDIDINQYPAADILAHHRLLTLWTNFVKYSNPTPEKDALLGDVIWPKVSPNNLTYLNINATLELKTDPRQYKKWKDVIETYAIPPLAVY